MPGTCTQRGRRELDLWLEDTFYFDFYRSKQCVINGIGAISGLVKPN